MLQCTLAAEGVHITASFDTHIVERWLVEEDTRPVQLCYAAVIQSQQRTR